MPFRAGGEQPNGGCSEIRMPGAGKAFVRENREIITR